MYLNIISKFKCKYCGYCTLKDSQHLQCEKCGNWMENEGSATKYLLHSGFNHKSLEDVVACLVYHVGELEKQIDSKKG